MTGTYLGWLGRVTPGVLQELEPTRTRWQAGSTVSQGGICSGKITGPTATLSFVGAVIRDFDEDTGESLDSYRCEVVLPVKGSVALILNLTFSAEYNLLSGSFKSAGASEEMISGWRQTWSPANRATNYFGTYHFTLTDSSGIDPLGNGFGA